jgi:hypothetical protein
VAGAKVTVRASSRITVGTGRVTVSGSPVGPLSWVTMEVAEAMVAQARSETELAMFALLSDD